MVPISFEFPFFLTKIKNISQISSLRLAIPHGIPKTRPSHRSCYRNKRTRSCHQTFEIVLQIQIIMVRTKSPWVIYRWTYVKNIKKAKLIIFTRYLINDKTIICWLQSWEEIKIMVKSDHGIIKGRRHSKIHHQQSFSRRRCQSHWIKNH